MKFFLSIGCVLVLFVWDVCEEQAFSLTNEKSGSVSATARLKTNFTNEESGSVLVSARLETNFSNESGNVSTTARLKTNFTNEEWRAGFTNAQSKMNFQFRIVGGEPANIKDFPYMVSVHRDHWHTCGGTLLSTTLVLTAAHCIYNLKRLFHGKYRVHEMGEMSVLVGTNIYVSSGLPKELQGEKRGVIAIFAPKHYSHPDQAGDIAVLKMSYPVRLTDKIQLVPRPSEVKMPEVGTVCTAVGWGISEKQVPGKPTGAISEPAMRKVDLNVADSAECQKVYPDSPIMRENLCTLTPGKDTCQGDSGGPLMCNGVQAAITSFGYGCAVEDKPGVYQRVDVNLDWLDKTIARALNTSSRYVSTSWSLHLSIFNVLFCYIYVTKNSSTLY